MPDRPGAPGRPGGPDPRARSDADAARRRALRDLARRHHPDRGGDAAEYVRLQAELEQRFARPRPLPDGRSSMIRVQAAARWRLVLRRLRRDLRRWRRARTARRRSRVDERLGAGRPAPVRRRAGRRR